MATPEGRAIVVAQLLRQGYSAQQVSKALKVTDAGGSLPDAFAALAEPDDPHYLASLQSATQDTSVEEGEAGDE